MLAYFELINIDTLGQEDHVSMGSIGALKLLEVYQNVEQVLAIELFTAAQALDFRKPLWPGREVGIAHKFVRDAIPHTDTDHYFKDDINKAVQLLQKREMVEKVEKESTELN